PPSAAQHFVSALRRQVLSRGHPEIDVLELIATLPTRALVIHARDDKEVPFRDGERIAATWPNAALLPVDGLGHRRILRAPQVVEAAVGFLLDA
ncbi:MAG: alpha/beta fold hydrolase, partial [Gemmatimonas sp.]